MKLFYSPFACSLATHIALREAAIDFNLEPVDLWSVGETELRRWNPMGQVPTVVTDEGRVLTENVAVLQWVSDRAPSLAGPDRYELTRWLSFVATEIHKRGLGLVFDPTSTDEVRELGRRNLERPLGRAEKHLAEHGFLVTSEFTVADAYLFWALTIAPYGGVSLEPYPNLRAYQARLLERPAVRAAVRFERDKREAATNRSS